MSTFAAIGCNLPESGSAMSSFGLVNPGCCRSVDLTLPLDFLVLAAQASQDSVSVDGLVFFGRLSFGSS